MSLWDDIVRAFTGEKPKITQKASPSPARKTSDRDVSRPSTTREPARPRFESVQAQPKATTPVFGGGGGGGGGMRGMSIGAAAPVVQREDDEPRFTMPDINNPTANFKPVEKDDKPQYTFWDDLFARLQQPSGGLGDPDFWAPIAGAAERKAKEDQKWTDVMGEGNLNPNGTVKVPTNDQLEQLGRDDDQVNIDGDLVPLNNSAGFNQQLRDRAAAADRQTYNEGLGAINPNATVRELTWDEWNALTPEQQEQVTANWALYQAALSDREAGETGQGKEDYQSRVDAIFGADGGSDTYAPNTVNLLTDLGYTTDMGDLDSFISGGAISTYEDILGQTQGARADARREIVTGLGESSLFDSEGLTTALAAGQELLDALRGSGSVSETFRQFSGLGQPAAASIPAEDQEHLRTILSAMTNRSIWSRLDTEPDLGADLQAELDQANMTYGPLLAQFFDENYKGFGGDDQYMSYDEFRNNWLEG